MKSAIASILTYCAVAFIGFGDIFAPLAFATVWSDRLGVSSWRAIALGCTILSFGVFLLPKRWLPSIAFKFSLSVALAMTTSTVVIGIYSDRIRHERIAAFGADERLEHSFFRSIREAPREFQFYLHSAVLKDCVAYGWSYRSMSFYRIPPSAAINVLPNSWLDRCPILRDAKDRIAGPPTN